MANMTDGERDQFLAAPRLGMLTTLREDGTPVTVPVWFEWDGGAVRAFSSVGSGKVTRIKRDPRASLTVANSLGEPEAWVAFDGKAAIVSEGAFELWNGLRTVTGTCVKLDIRTRSRNGALPVHIFV